MSLIKSNTSLSSRNSEALIKNIEQLYLKKDIRNILIGDSIKVGFLIKEGNKDRIQYYQGVVISKKNTGINFKIVVRKVFQGIGIERQFLPHSPKFESLEILKSAYVRRSKLYYLRKISGKASRLKQKFKAQN